MRKKIIALGASIFSAIAITAFSFDAKAVTTDVVTNDEFVFDANTKTVGTEYSKNTELGSIYNTTLKMGNFSGGVHNANGFEFGDYKFDKALLAYSTDNTKPCYYVTAPENTKIGIYYTLSSKTQSNGSYTVSDDSTIEVVKEVKKTTGIIFRRTTTDYEVQQVYTEKANYMYYSEFTFADQGTIGIRAGDQYLWLFGLTVVTEEEITYRNQADIAISELLAYYNENGVDNSKELDELISNAKNAISTVNHISQIDEYDEYLVVLNEYEAVKADYNKALDVEALIDSLGDVEYSDSFNEKLAEIENALADLNNVSFVSNLDSYNEKKNAFNELSNEKVNAYVNKVNEASIVAGTTDSYLLIKDAENLYNELINADKNLNDVLAANELLESVKEAYAEYQETNTDTSYKITYKEDGSINKIYLVGTLYDYTQASDYYLCTFYVTNLLTGETYSFEKKSFALRVKINGEVIKDKISGVSYITYVISCADYNLNGCELSYYYSLQLMNTSVIESNVSEFEVK